MAETANKNATHIDKMHIEAKGRELTVTRTFDAPRDLVWKAWTEAESLSRWFAPKGWTVPHCTVDFRPGGVWHFLMRGPAGEESWGRAALSRDRSQGSLRLRGRVFGQGRQRHRRHACLRRDDGVQGSG